MPLQPRSNLESSANEPITGTKAAFSCGLPSRKPFVVHHEGSTASMTLSVFLRN
jgi:hypothetical protein